ncbi:glycosyltransferase [bacterium]|nr:glycosyltransferase [bacterium]
MKTIHLCTMDFGGAGKAAYRLHKGLQSIGIASTMMVISKKSNDPSVLVLPSGVASSSIDRWTSFFQHWNAILAAYPHRPQGLEMFTDTACDVCFDMINEIRDADVINLHWVAGLFDYEHAAQLFKGKKVVWTLHDMNPFTGGCHYAGNCLKYQESCEYCPQLGSSISQDLSRSVFEQKAVVYNNLNITVVTPSRWLGGCSSNSTLFGRFQHEVIPYGFPLDTFRPLDRIRIRASLKIPADAKVVLFGADYVSNERKGFRYLIAALNHLKNIGIQHNLILAIFGNIDPAAEISCGYPILPFGSVANEEQMAQLYNAADVFVLPSLEDNLPNTVVEALACGTPVAAFEVGGVPDMVKHLQSGFLAEVRDTDGLAAGIEWCICQATDDIRHLCRLMAETYFPLERQARSYQALYEEGSTACNTVVSCSSMNRGKELISTPAPENNFGLVELNGIRGYLCPGDIRLLYATAHIIPKGGTIIEVGSHQWLSSYIMAQALIDSGNHDARIHCVDMWEGGVVDVFMENMKTAGVAHLIRPVQHRSPEATNLFLDESSDLIFINGDHSYEGCKADLQGWYPKLKPGGTLLGHDYSESTFPGVVKAANEFVHGHGLNTSFIAPHQETHLFEVRKPDRANRSEAKSLANQPRISIITASYNQAQFIEQTIKSVLNQKHTNIEHIIIDGGSTDGTIEILKKYPHIKWVSEKDNGQSEAINKGFRMASGDIIAWLNSDDFYLENAFTTVVQTFQRSPHTKVLMGDVLVFVEGSNKVRCESKNRDMGFDDIIRYWWDGMPPQPGVFFKADILKKYGLLDEKLNFAMDYDFWLRIAQHETFRHVPHALAAYRLHPTSKSGADNDWSRFYPEWFDVYQRNKHFSKCIPQKTLLTVVLIVDKDGIWLKPEALQNSIAFLGSQCIWDMEILVLTDDDKYPDTEHFKIPIPVRIVKCQTLHPNDIALFVRDKAVGHLIHFFPRNTAIPHDWYCRHLEFFLNNKDLGFVVDPGVTNDNNPFIKHIKYSSQPIDVRSIYRFETLCFDCDRQLELQTVMPISEIQGEVLKSLEKCSLVSIIVPTCNRSAILGDFLAALESQTYPKDRFELIIVDDGSTDDTETVVSSFMPSFQLVYFKQENRGPATARNKGIRNARGELILILNDDAIAAPDLIEQHVAAHAKYHDKKTIVLGSFPFAEAYLNTPLMHLFQQSDILFQYSRMKAHERYDYRYFWTCNISIPHRAFSEAGFFDEDFRDPAGEDTELGYRLWDKGYSINYEPECRTQHAHSIPFINYCRRQITVGRNSILIAAKHPEITTTVTGLHNIIDAEQIVSSWLKANSEIAIKAFNAIRSVDGEIENERAGNIAKDIGTVIPIVNQFWLYQGFMDGLSEYSTERVSSSERLRITLLSPGTAISGGVKIIFEYSNRLAERGHEVNLVTLDGKKPSWFQFSPNVRYIEASWDEDLLLRLLPDADVIFATFWATAYLVSRFPACKGKRYYLVQGYESQTIASPEEADPTYLLPLKKIVVSTWLKETLSQLFGQHSLIVPNAVDHTLFYHDPSHRKCFPLSDFRIGMLWHHEEGKGLATGMAAFQMIKNHIPDAKLVLMGVKRPEQIFFDEFHENISGNDVRLFYSSLDVFVSNSTQEGFGLPGLEAMACGIPLVTTDSGGVRDYAVHQKTALVVPARDPDAIAKAVLLLAEDANLRERLRITGLEKSAQFSWDSSVSMIEAALIGSYDKSRSVEIRMNDQSAGKEVQRREKISIAVFSLDSKNHACGYYRMLSPALALTNSVNLIWGLSDNLNETQITAEELNLVDLIIIQRFFPRPETIEFINYLFSFGKPVVYEVDDLLTQLPSTNPSHDWGMICKPFIYDISAKCSAITVSTDALSRHFTSYNTNVRILPNLLNDRLWCKTTPPSQGPVIIGYAGTITHSADLTLLEEVLEKISSKYSNKVAFTFMGCSTERISRLPGFSFISFETTYEAYARKLQEIPLDIMLVPLEDNPFNRCKSNIKWLEYSACGIAGIYADLPPYNTTVAHGKTGLLVGQNTDKWVHAIELLIEHPDLRKQIARQAREEVLSKYTLQKGVHRYLDLYENLLNNCAERQTGVKSETSAGKVKVSIIIPLFNQLTYTKQCLEALACSTGTTIPYEVILVDNGSTDGTRDFLSSINSTIRVLSNPSNLGFAKACNQGAAVADGEYLVFLNNDTIPQSGWLDALVSSATVDGADICGAKLLYPDGRVQHAGVAFDERGIGYHIFKNFQSDAKAVNSKRFMQCVTGACLLISKRLFQQLGGFDDLFMNGFEDVDLCLRAGVEGKKVLYTPESVLIHFEEKSEGRKIHDDRNMKLFLSRWGGKVRCDDDLFYRKEGFMQQQNAEGKIVIRPIDQDNISNQRPRA